MSASRVEIPVPAPAADTARITKQDHDEAVGWIVCAVMTDYPDWLEDLAIRAEQYGHHGVAAAIRDMGERLGPRPPSVAQELA